MISIQDAQNIILRHIGPLHVEEMPILQCLGRVISENIHAPWDIPLADKSAMDGYAYCHAGLKGNQLKVTGFLPAGAERMVPVAAGEAIRIMTGASIPPGCDTVIPLESVEEVGEGVQLNRDSKVGAHILKQGDDVRKNDCCIAAGTLLRPAEIGMLVSLGKTTARVFSRPVVAILATGDELVAAGSIPGSGRIINSNSYSIAAQVMEAGGNPVILGIAPDDRNATTDKIITGLQSDILITSGGISVGDKDYVKEVIIALGGEIIFWKVNMKPGKPFMFAMLKGKPIFALPGNPAATMVGFEQFVRPAMLRLIGHQNIFRPIVNAQAADTFENREERPHLMLVQLSLNNGIYHVSSAGSQSSSHLSSMTRANGLMTVAPGKKVAPGDVVDVSVLNTVH
jgi:molybdopterin molybdotransferase